MYGHGLLHCSVCAPADMSLPDVEAAVNAQHPTGIESPWRKSDDSTFASGEPNPCPCSDGGDRLHWLMDC